MAGKGISTRLITTQPLFFPVYDGCVITNIGANSVFYKTAADVDVGDTELAAAASVTLTGQTWFVAAAGASSRILVDYVGAEDYSQQLQEIQATYRTVLSHTSILLPDTLSAATYVAPFTSSTASAASATTAGLGVVYLDPADYAVTGKTTQYRVRATLLTNATSVDTLTVTWGLYPVSATAGGTDASTITLGTVTSGSTVAFADQAISTRAQGNSGVFTAPAAGYYALAAVLSDAPGANSHLIGGASLQVKNA